MAWRTLQVARRVGSVIQPNIVIEIGKATGLSALALKKFLPLTSKVITFDIIPWQKYPGQILRPAGFPGGRLEQVTADLTNLDLARRHASLLQAADLLFVDAAKDGRMEAVLLSNFSTIGLKERAWLLFDDTRMMNMISIWRSISRPKLDLTSFGHWSGAGLVHWTRGG